MSWRRPRRFYGAPATCNWRAWLGSSWVAMHDVPSDFTSRPQRVHCADCVQRTSMQWHPKALREVSVQALSTYHCAFTAIMCLITLARRQSSSGASSDLAALPRRPPPPFLLCVCQNAEPRRVLCVCSKYASSNGDLCDPIATNEDVAASFRHCRRLYCGMHAPRRSAFFSWTQQDSLKDATPVCQGF